MLPAAKSETEAATANTIESLGLPAPHPAQQRILDEARRFNVVCMGRRSGKTTLGVRLLIEPALRGLPVAWMSPTYKMLADVWREVRNVLYDAPRISEAGKRIELASGGVVEMWSLEKPDAIRGRKYARVVIDEAAMIRELGHVWAAVIRPTLTDLIGDAFFLSTPRGRNFFWQCYERGQPGADTQHADWASWKMPSTCNPHLDPAEIQAMRDSLPEKIASQEIDAEAVSDGTVFRNVSELATGATQPPYEGHVYIIGADWAGTGAGGDWTVFVVVDATVGRVVAMDRFNGLSYQMQQTRLWALYEHYQAEAVYAELNNMGDPIAESLYSSGMRVYGLTTTNASKAGWVNRLALALEERAIVLLNDDILKSELLAFESTRLPGGAFRYAAPEGQHDDTVMALLLAWQGVGKPRGAGLLGVA